MVEFLEQVLVDFWATVAEMSPYLLFGFFVAGLLSVLVSQKMVERHLGGRGLLPVLKASLFGVPLPLCSCGVIPVSMSLHKHGASKGSTISFLLSTPQTGADSILVTYSLLGPVFAIFRPLVAFVTGLIGGGLVDIFAHSSETPPEPPKPAEDACCCHKPKHRFLEALRYGFVSLPRDIGKPLLVGLVVAALIGVIVPDDFLAERLGTGLPAMLVMMAVGIPLYVCASASVPVAAALILKGLSPGAAFVFLMTGPATNAAGLATIWSTLGRRAAIIYLLTVAGCALASGLLLDSLISSVDVAMASHDHQMGPGLLGHLSAVILLAVLGYAFLSPKRH
ncbi:MAG: permease [Sedimentisphaerales bacterium]|nr:permease [Sedimentisphaerales bacterium]